MVEDEGEGEMKVGRRKGEGVVVCVGCKSFSFQHGVPAVTGEAGMAGQVQ